MCNVWCVVCVCVCVCVVVNLMCVCVCSIWFVLNLMCANIFACLLNTGNGLIKY